jgi:hypothetical protein
MTDLRDDFKQICDGLNRISLIAQLRDKVAYALKAYNKRCGDCVHWMKSRDCPLERNVKGYSRGPSCDAPVCSKFVIKQRAVELQQKRTTEAIEFAKAHDLPIPDCLKQERDQ